MYVCGEWGPGVVVVVVVVVDGCAGCPMYFGRVT